MTVETLLSRIDDTLDDRMRDAVKEALPVAAVVLATSGAMGYTDSSEAMGFVDADPDVQKALAALDASGSSSEASNLLLHTAERAYTLGLAVGLRMARALEN